MENTSDLFVGISNCHTYQGLRRRSTPLTCTAALAASAGDSNSHCAFFNGHFSSPERRLPVRNPIKVITSNRWLLKRKHQSFFIHWRRAPSLSHCLHVIRLPLTEWWSLYKLSGFCDLLYSLWSTAETKLTRCLGLVNLLLLRQIFSFPVLCTFSSTKTNHLWNDSSTDHLAKTLIQFGNPSSTRRRR